MPINPLRIHTGTGHSNGHPFVISFDGLGLSVEPIALPGIVVFCPTKPRVVGRFVVVPHTDERILLVEAHQGFIQAVLGQAHAVILQLHNLCAGLIGPVVAVLAVAVFVVIIAQVQNGRDIVALPNAVIGIEIAVGIRGTRDHGKAQTVHITYWGRLGTPND